MPSVRKIKLAFKIIGKDEAMAALELYASKHGSFVTRLGMDANEFNRIYSHPYEDTIAEIWKWRPYIIPEKRNYSLDEV